MKQKIYQIDAFTDQVFTGNPAAVCPLDQWLSDDLLQKIAMENNLAETAFYVKKEDHYELRWFTPAVEVDLCGHATLASAFVLFNHENHKENIIHFHTRKSGILTVSKHDDWLTLNFPTDSITPIPVTGEIIACFDIEPTKAFEGRTDYMFVFNSEDEIRKVVPSFAKIVALKARGVIITAKGKEVDFVSRFFGPQVGVNEDPVTGSAHTTLTPYWSKELDKTDMTAKQLSAREGFLKCKYLGDRVEISGQGRLYLMGEIFID
jgi:PhzF family phenazine biosynthesis protein